MTSPAQTATEPVSGRRNLWLPVAIVLGVLVAVALVVRVDTRGYSVPSAAMAPTVRAGDHVTANLEAYDGGRGIRVGDIVVFHPPTGATSASGPQCGVPIGYDELCPRSTGRSARISFIKRVVAVEGDRVTVRDGRAVVDGRRASEPYIKPCGGAGCSYRQAITVPRGTVYVLGDNRGASDDSRFWGPVPVEDIVGRIDDCFPPAVIALSCSRRG